MHELPADVEGTVRRYLADLDRRLPGRVTAFYVVGSVALGAFRPGRSDVDFVAVVDGDLHGDELRAIRAAQLRSAARTGSRSIGRRRSPLAGTCNGIFVRGEDIRRPVSEIVPLASQIGTRLRIGVGGSDLSPVGWKVLAERGIAIRGPEPTALGLDAEADRLRPWNLANLDGYWRPWAQRAVRSPGPRFWLRPRWSTAWGALGAPRLHRTIATGEVIGKEQAGEYALDVLDARWYPLLVDALKYWRGTPGQGPRLSPSRRARLTGELVLEVVASAHALPGPPTDA